MRTVLLATSLVLGLAVTGCSGTDSVDDASTSPSATGSTAPESSPEDSASASATEEPTDPAAGPLQLDDSRGRACASLRVGREYTAWEHVLEPDTDVTLGRWSLVGAENVEVGRGFVAELPGDVPATGFTLGFPPAPEDVDSRTIDWAGRRPAVGATLEAGTRSNFWVRIQVDEGVRRAGYRGITLHYTADGQEYTAFSDIRTRFRPRCA